MIEMVKPKLKRLKLSAMAEILEEKIREATREKWSYSEFFEQLLAEEIERREQRNQLKRQSQSHLDPTKTLESYDWEFNAKLHEPTIRELSSCDFIKAKENLFFLGPSGVGKSHLAQALGHEACRRGYDVLFYRMTGLFRWIHSGRGDGSYRKRLEQVIKSPLLILDDFGLQPLTEDQQEDLYEVVCGRYEQRSTVITSNRDLSEWHGMFGSPLMGSAAIDRLVHRATSIEIEGASYRLRSFQHKNKRSCFEKSEELR